MVNAADAWKGEGASINYVEKQGEGVVQVETILHIYLEVRKRKLVKKEEGRGRKNPHNQVNLTYGCP